MESIRGCPYSIIPSIDQTGLIELKSLYLSSVKGGLECIIDMTQQHAPSSAFSHLVDLYMNNVPDLGEICKGGNPPHGFLEKLETLKIVTCHRIKNCLFPPFLSQRLGKLRDARVSECRNLEHVFQFEERVKGNPCLLAGLSSLRLSNLESMYSILKSPTQQLKLQNLTTFYVDSCHKLSYIFTLDVARSLTQLRFLSVGSCNSLKHIVEINAAARDGKDVVLPNLRELRLLGLWRLISFCSEGYVSTWPALEQLDLRLKWTPSFVAELEANIQVRTLFEKITMMIVSV